MNMQNNCGTRYSAYALYLVFIHLSQKEIKQVQ